MTHFPDLSPYTYSSDDDPALNIGWLDESFPFPTGRSDGLFLEKLAWICARQERVNQMRGVHNCNLCESVEETWHYLQTSHGNHLLGSAELRVGHGQLFAAPDLVLHYVVDHAYQPPLEFVNAVKAIDERLPRSEWLVVPRRP